MGQELELKYRANADALKAIRDAFPGDYTEYQMATTYYDTADGALSARHWTLRCRRENDVFVCTLKTPTADPRIRGEWDTECDDILTAIPVLAEKSGNGELLTLTAGGIVPTCGARFTRQALMLNTGSCEAELALDQGVLMGGGRELPFAEMELELKAGDPLELKAIAQTIAHRFGLEQESKSKFARAKRLSMEV